MYRKIILLQLVFMWTFCDNLDGILNSTVETQEFPRKI